MKPQSGLTPWEEHEFWLSILQDHAYFVFETLSPSDTDYVNAAGSYVKAFERLLAELQKLDAKDDAANPNMVRFAQAVLPVAEGYYRFEGHLQSLRIQNRIALDLSPTYLNGTLSENVEYNRLLASFAAGVEPAPLSLADLVDLWLEDQLGHALLLADHIDVAEVGWSRKIREYQDTFSALMVKQRQIRNYLRFMPPGFPVQRQFAEELFTVTNGFAELVHQVVNLYLRERILNRLTLRFIEHHFPETCYFLNKLSLYVPELPLSPCSLIKPSFNRLNEKNPGIGPV
jgi:hypothetical protein